MLQGRARMRISSRKGSWQIKGKSLPSRKTLRGHNTQRGEMKVGSRSLFVARHMHVLTGEENVVLKFFPT